MPAGNADADLEQQRRQRQRQRRRDALEQPARSPAGRRASSGRARPGRWRRSNRNTASRSDHRGPRPCGRPRSPPAALPVPRSSAPGSPDRRSTTKAKVTTSTMVSSARPIRMAKIAQPSGAASAGAGAGRAGAIVTRWQATCRVPPGAPQSPALQRGSARWRAGSADERRSRRARSAGFGGSPCSTIAADAAPLRATGDAETSARV